MNSKQVEEYIKCKENPYYFMTNYVHIVNFETNKKEPFTTNLTEKEFNGRVKKFESEHRLARLQREPDLNHEKI
jgi:hypothetical protein